MRVTPRETAAALVACGDALYDLSTNATPRAAKAAEAMRSLELGDLVVVHHVLPDVPALDRVGHLCASAGCWEILTLDGRVVCWENVLVLRLPVDRHGTGTPARGRRAKCSE